MKVQDIETSSDGKPVFYKGLKFMGYFKSLDIARQEAKNYDEFDAYMAHLEDQAEKWVDDNSFILMKIARKLGFFKKPK